MGHEGSQPWATRGASHGPHSSFCLAMGPTVPSVSFGLAYFLSLHRSGSNHLVLQCPGFPMPVLPWITRRHRLVSVVVYAGLTLRLQKCGLPGSATDLPRYSSDTPPDPHTISLHQHNQPGSPSSLQRAIATQVLLESASLFQSPAPLSRLPLSRPLCSGGELVPHRHAQCGLHAGLAVPHQPCAPLCRERVASSSRERNEGVWTAPLPWRLLSCGQGCTPRLLIHGLFPLLGQPALPSLTHVA